MSTTLEDFRHKPGTCIKTEFGTPLMVIQLCAGMRLNGVEASGGKETVACVSLETGITRFEHGSLIVKEVEMIK